MKPVTLHQKAEAELREALDYDAGQRVGTPLEKIEVGTKMRLTTT